MSKDVDMAEQALTEREKMLRGLAYDVADPELIGGKIRARGLLKAYNGYPLPTSYDPALPLTQYFGPDERTQILADLFGIPLEKARVLIIESTFLCDYGTNIHFKGSAYMNYNCTVLYLYPSDNAPPLTRHCAQVTIGTRVMFAPNVNIYASGHSTDVVERRGRLGRAHPVTIGDDLRDGRGQIAEPGDVLSADETSVSRLVVLTRFRIGVTVAAGSVVKGDFPDNVIIGGVPARILKHLDPPPPLSE
ncbi:hypothetical protein BU17DRAFT_62047 [Hysterangium stoloniferum]|nr:hypothetical protein BU17DRAFT_62047 [Hysterangium stoloniferum]